MGSSIHLKVPHLIVVTQTRNDRFDNALGFAGALHGDGDDACLYGRVVIASHKQGVSDVNHLFYWYAENVSELSYSIGLVNARLGNVDGCRATESDRELWDESVED